MGMSNVVAAISSEFRWSVSNPPPNITSGSNIYQPISNSGDIRKIQNFGTAALNTATGGGDEVFSFQQGITAGNSATLDLTAMSNLLGQSGVSIARIKGIQFRLLSGTDDSSLTPTPTGSSTVTITNRGVTLPCQMDFGNGGSGLTTDITVGGGGALSTASINNAGSGYPPLTVFTVSPNQTNGTGGVLTAGTNNAGSVNTLALVTAATGSNYANAAAVPTTVGGHYNILTGGAHVYFDPAALGMCVVDSLHKNIKILNLDTTHAVTVEIDIFAATT